MTPCPLDPEFIRTVCRNCDLSDANGAAIFSICGMALRLRDLNKWENGLDAWQENDPAQLLEWIDAKEQLWEQQGETPFQPLPLQGQTYDPFDTVAVNQVLDPLGYFYGAGFAHSLKPTFFLARVDISDEIRRIPLRMLGKELARDLLTIPALNQDDTVVFRRDAARFFLWDQMAYIKKSGRRFLNFALKALGLPDARLETRRAHFESILEAQAASYIHHEIGEIEESVFHRHTFRDIVSCFPHTPVELLTRTVKDLLADTGPRGTLLHILSTKNAGNLGLYAAFQDGLFRPLFPQLRPAVEKFVSDRDWEGIERARQKGFTVARQYAMDLIGLFETGKQTGDLEQAARDIRHKLLAPLT